MGVVIGSKVIGKVPKEDSGKASVIPINFGHNARVSYPKPTTRSELVIGSKFDDSFWGECSSNIYHMAIIDFAYMQKLLIWLLVSTPEPSAEPTGYYSRSKRFLYICDVNDSAGRMVLVQLGHLTQNTWSLSHRHAASVTISHSSFHSSFHPSFHSYFLPSSLRSFLLSLVYLAPASR